MYPTTPKNISRFSLSSILWLAFCLIATVFFLMPESVQAQTEVTGAIEGHVTSRKDPNTPVVGAAVQIINLDSQVQSATKTDAEGRFVKNQLPPGRYKVVVKASGYSDYESDKVQRVDIEVTNRAVPVPISLEPASTTNVAVTTPSPSTTTVTAQPGASPGASPGTSAKTTTTTTTGQEEDFDIRREINTTDARRGGAFRETEVSTLPLGGTTLVRSFDELALLLPGVALPPQTQGSVAGPGVGPGVGSAGQFAVNGIRSRANNFTVDGSDNNDEDIGVRRQGFFTLIPQPIESVQEYRVTTLLAPAQYGRNIGAQVNAVSKSGGSATHGSIYGFFNSSQLNARNVFDTTGGPSVTPLMAGGRRVVINCLSTDASGNFNGAGCPTATVPLNNGGKDSFTLAQGGFAFGGPLEPSRGPNKPPRMFYFFSMEGQNQNANQEQSFAVPTIAQRGAFGTGATGISRNPLTGAAGFAFPTTLNGDEVFSFFPFPNNPNGVYGANTYTEVLPASAQGKVASGKFDSNFKIRGHQQSFTARYNFTQDWRDIPAVGGALFARLRSNVRTQNFSTFLNSELNGPNSTKAINNQLRLSYGRTRLRFDPGNDPNDQGVLRPVRRQFNNPLDAQLLLNARLLENDTLPGDTVVTYLTGAFSGRNETETDPFGSFTSIGPIGQLIVSGFSPVGVDVFNFPQRRVNNTYQMADTVTLRAGKHSYAFGADIRRTELNSALPRNARPLVTFTGAPRVILDANGNFVRFANANDPNPFIRPEDFAAAGAATGFFQALVQPGSDSGIHLRYYQLNFFGQDEWRIRPNLSLSLGLRYEYNTVPRELNQRIESTFNSSSLGSLVSGLSNFINGRTSIYDPDRNNFAPRVGFAWSPRWFADKTTVIRAGYGLFYDQILGAVVSQSRNVFPTFSTINFGGGCNSGCFNGQSNTFIPYPLNFFNPALTFYFQTGLGYIPIIQNGTLNTINPQLTLGNLVTTTNNFFGNLYGQAGNSAFGATLPAKNLQMPMAHQYSVTFEQQLNRNLVFSAAYVGTMGRNLLRFTTPNLGPNLLVIPTSVTLGNLQPDFLGITLPPGSTLSTAGIQRSRPTRNVGVVNIFETSARSRYDALQLQVRGRFTTRFSYQVNYTFSSVKDDASDVFDLAGSPSLPQDSRTFAGEYAPANFDARHRFSYDFIWDLPTFSDRSPAFRRLFGGLQIAGTGKFQTGQPFTVNSLFDVNLDGNLTDRLNSTSGITVTGNRAQPLALNTNNPASLLAAIGQDGNVPRNSFRAGNVLDLDLSVIKKFAISESKNITFRMDIFNFINRANYGIPVRFLEAPGFGKAVNTVTPGRRIQFALKFNF